MKNEILKLPVVVLFITCLVFITIGLFKHSNLIESEIGSFEISHKGELQFYGDLVGFACEMHNKIDSLTNSRDFIQTKIPSDKFVKLGNVLTELYKSGQKIRLHKGKTRTRSNSLQTIEFSKELQLALQNGANACYVLAEISTSFKNIPKNEKSTTQNLNYDNLWKSLTLNVNVSNEDQSSFNDIYQELNGINRKMFAIEHMANTIEKDLVRNIDLTVGRLEWQYTNVLSGILIGKTKKRAGLLRLKALLNTSLGINNNISNSCKNRILIDFLDTLDIETKYKKAVHLD